MSQECPKPAILALGTAVPRYQYQQQHAASWMSDALGSPPGLTRWLSRLYALSGIDTRYSCLPDAMSAPDGSRYSPGATLADSATTAERMAVYEREATALGVAAAQRALDTYAMQAGDDGRADVSSISHVIAVSCTGFFAPGLDLAIARQLRLRPNVQRTLVGFMGCAAAFNALRLADQIVRADASARVLIVCVELCSLHIQPGQERTNLIVASLFADGAAACVVGRAEPHHGDIFRLGGFHTHLEPSTEDKMVWQIGNNGFTLELSPDVPLQLGKVAPRALETLLGDRPRPDWWAIHPGGRAIVDRLVEIFDLRADQSGPSYEVLRKYGNMSSPTILFVLHTLQQQLRQAESDRSSDGVAMAFGPGLVTEMVSLTYVPQQASAWSRSDMQVQGVAVERVA